MSRRDLLGIGIGSKTEYDAYPYRRAQLANLRDLSLTDKELDQVAQIADEFDAEDQAWVEAGMALRRAKGEGLPDRFSAWDFANLTGYISMAAFEADRAKGVIPPPDGVFNGLSYWRRETIEKTRAAP